MTDMAAILQARFVDAGPLYAALVTNENFEGFNRVTDTMGSHDGWEEFVDINESTRPLWEPGVVVDGNPASVANQNVIEFTPTVDGEVIAFFLCDDDTVGGTTGQLFGPYFFVEGKRPVVAGKAFRPNCKLKLKGT